MASVMLEFLYKKNYDEEGLPRPGVNVTNWGPPENRTRERFLGKYGAQNDDDRNFLSSLSTLAAPEKSLAAPEKSLQPAQASQASTTTAEPKKKESTPQPVKSKKTKGQTIMDPLALKDETYRKKLLGD